MSTWPDHDLQPCLDVGNHLTSQRHSIADCSAEDQWEQHAFLHLQGFLHEIDIAPSGTAADPWPFVLISQNGHGETSVMVHRDDAEKIIEFFQRHLEKP